VPTVVVAALSARQLALSARRAGWNVVALDCFGDVDTRAAVQRWEPIGATDAIRIDGARFLAALRSARGAPDCFGWIAGAGFEPEPQLLEEAAHVLPLLGNDRTVTEHLRDPRRFFAALDGLGIPHPQTQFQPPLDAQGWLVKDFASSGGWHVHRLSLPRPAGETERGVHYQREVRGRPMSLLFLADGRRAVPIAMNTLRVRAIGTRPFVYHGALGPLTDLPPHVPTALGRAVDALVDAFQLRGLGSLDVMVDGETIDVLELNARPTGTFGLYDSDAPHGLLHWHVEACRGTLPAPALRIDTRRARGEGIVFTTRRCRIDAADVARLAALGCRDIPQPQSDIAPGAPLCTVTAHDPSIARVHEQLAAREAAVLALVQNRNEVTRHAK
jgi:predicted ATP-grasp superfamily ATP-dependent carboligase